MLLQLPQQSFQFPVCAEFTADLHSLGQLIQDGKRNLFETMLRFDPPQQKYTIGGDWKNLDGLNYLEGKTLDQVEEDAWFETVDAHTASGVPVITVECGELTEKTVGQLLRFAELSGQLSAAVGTPAPELESHGTGDPSPTGCG